MASELPLPDESEASANWREQLRVLATGYRNMLLRHPWASRLLAEFINIGSHSTAFSNATLQVIGRSGLKDVCTSGALASLFHFVYGFATIRATHEARCRAAGISLHDDFEQVVSAISSHPEFAEMKELSSRGDQVRTSRSAAAMLDRDFAFALDLQIAGIEAMRGGERGEG
ncbi:TetR/AcrR family transcriptional regulator C-terminal domain-containing protein [Streptomyces sp. NPDC048506]|uniref:TetR/AcrR family transcriptional regulator C-terminal domain-containing protein n=1 Tax=Streptomyces sp. NPDC048506 TaxID=3155028 RepID=UPI003449179F